MFGSSQKIRRIGNDVLVLGTTWASRIAFAAFAVLMGIAAFWGSRVVVVPLVVAILLVFGALFVDEWQFDAASREARRRSGLLFLAATRHIEVDSIERIELISFRRAMARVPFARILLVTEAREIVIEMGPDEAGELTTRAQLIAEHLGVALKLPQQMLD